MNKKKNKLFCSTTSKESINQKESTQLELFSQTSEKNTYSVVNFGEISKLKQKLQSATESNQTSLNQQTIPQISGQEIQKLETRSIQGHQCDQICSFLKAFGSKFSYKRSPNFW